LNSGLKFRAFSTRGVMGMPDYRVKISTKLDYHAFHNLSSNPTAEVTESDNNQFYISFDQTQVNSKTMCVTRGRARFS
jgi:hypothetical protein